MNVYRKPNMGFTSIRRDSTRTEDAKVQTVQLKNQRVTKHVYGSAK